MRLPLGFALLMGCVTAWGQQSQSTALRCEQQILEAERKSDLDVFRRLLSKDFVAIGPDGLRHSKEEMLQVLATLPKQRVSASDFVAIAAGKGAMIVNYVVRQPSPDGERSHNATSVWLLRGGSCSMIFHQGTVIPKP